LKLDDHPYSPTVLARIVYLTGVCESAEAAALALQEAAEIQVAPRTAQKLATQVGSELGRQRDHQAEAYEQQPLPRRPHEVSPPPQLAAGVFFGTQRSCFLQEFVEGPLLVARRPTAERIGIADLGEQAGLFACRVTDQQPQQYVFRRLLALGV
jgi:hypothetical protein